MHSASLLSFLTLFLYYSSLGFAAPTPVFPLDHPSIVERNGEWHKEATKTSGDPLAPPEGVRLEW
ncbi:hypothetical protein FRC12_001226 [Ceratobasidium sp. 428]|nr:hypothetical protein FRC12_001226 [Ceratobasidium sp. 428]